MVASCSVAHSGFTELTLHYKVIMSSIDAALRLSKGLVQGKFSLNSAKPPESVGNFTGE